MKRLQRRTLITILIAGVMLGGLVYFSFRLITKGGDWVGFFGNTYYASGAIYDRNGVKLYDGATGEYAENKSTRVSTLHLVGDRNFGTSLRSVLSGELTGYNPITGTTLGSHDVTLTLDSTLNQTAYNALNGHKGVVAVYDYTNGDVKCLVSAPSYDPNNPPSDVNENPAYDGVYLNRFFSGTYPPGSTFKLITTAAALEQKKDVAEFRFTCTGNLTIGNDVITCPYVHGSNMDINASLTCSCNGAYATLALELGGDTIAHYMEQAGLMKSLTVCDIPTAKGSYVVEPAGSPQLGWSGVGQDKDLANPCSMLSFVGGIANNGVAVVPRLVAKETLTGSAIPAGFPEGKETYDIYSAETCATLKQMMRNNVTAQYGQAKFGDLAVCAKSGTAEVGGGNSPHAWFVGFIDDPKIPLAFVVLVENGGFGADVAGRVAATVLAEAAAKG